MAAFIGFTVPGPAQLSSQMHLPGSGSQITLYSSVSNQASACETISCLPPRKRLIFRAVACPFLLLGLLQWGRLSQWGPVNADNISTLFLALFIRQRLICMQWLAFPAVFWLAYGEFCGEFPGTHYLTLSVSHISHVIPQSNHRHLATESDAAVVFSLNIHACLFNALRVLLILCSVAS